MRKWLSLGCPAVLLAWSAACFATQHAWMRVHHWQTNNGLYVWYVYRPQVPMLDLRLVVQAGSAFSMTPGLAWMTAHGLSMGAAGITETQIAQGFAQSGARFHVRIGREIALFSLKSLVDPANLQVATAVFSSVLGSPTFPPEVLAVRKSQHLADLKLQDERHMKLAYNLLYRQLYPHSAYGQPAAGTAASISAIDAAALKAFYNQYYVARNMCLILVGDITPIEAKAIGQQISNVLPMGMAASPPKIQRNTNHRHEFIRQNHHAQQAIVLVGTRAVPVSESNYWASVVAAEVLGGENSRLYQTISGQNGWVYRFGAYATGVVLPGIFTVFAETRTQNIEQVLATLRPAVTALAEQGPAPAELALAKQVILGRLLLRLSSDDGVSSRLVWLAENHLPADDLNQVAEKISAVTMAQVTQVLQQLMRHQPKAVVVVGQV